MTHLGVALLFYYSRFVYDETSHQSQQGPFNQPASTFSSSDLANPSSNDAVTRRLTMNGAETSLGNLGLVAISDLAQVATDAVRPSNSTGKSICI